MTVMTELLGREVWTRLPDGHLQPGTLFAIDETGLFVTLELDYTHLAEFRSSDTYPTREEAARHGRTAHDPARG